MSDGVPIVRKRSAKTCKAELNYSTFEVRNMSAVPPPDADVHESLKRVQQFLQHEPQYLSKSNIHDLKHFTKHLQACNDSTAWLSIQRNWARLCLQLVTDSAPYAKCSKLAEKIEKLLAKLSSSPKQETESSPASELRDLIQLPNFKMAFEKLLSDQARDYQRRFPEDIATSCALVERITQGAYGAKLKNVMLDSHDNPLLLLSGFLRLLLIDQILEGKDPKKSISWFSEVESQEVATISRAVAAIQVKLASQAALSKREIHSILITPKPHFSHAIEKAINSICGKASLNQTIHSILLEHIGHYFHPTNAQLHASVTLCLEERLPDRAFSLALFTAGKEKDAMVQKVLQEVTRFEDGVVSCCSLVETLLLKDPEYYVQAVSLLAPILVKSGHMQVAVHYALDIEFHAQYCDLVAPLLSTIAALPRSSENEEALCSLIECSASLEIRAKVLEHCLEQFLRQDNAEPFATRVVYCQAFLENIKNKQLRLLGLSSLLFITLKNTLVALKYEEKGRESLPNYVRLAEGIDDKTVRHDLFERLCRELLKDPVSDLDIERVEILIGFCSEGEDKSFLQKQLALVVDKINHPKALEIVSRIKDQQVKLQTIRLIALETDEVPTNNKSTSGTARGVLHYLSRALFSK